MEKKYQIIEAWILHEFQEDRILPGEKLPSESALCSQFEVSRNVVRQALSNLRNGGFITSVDKVGSFRAESTDRHADSSMNIGLVMYNVDSYIFPKIIRGSTQELSGRGYHLLLGHSDYRLEEERNLIENFITKGVDGLIIEPVYSPESRDNRDLLEQCEARGIPVVLLDNAYSGDAFSAVVLDDRSAGGMASRYLLDCGHTDIGILYTDDYYPKIKRMEGALDALAKAGRAVPENRIIRMKAFPNGGFRQAYEAMMDFFSEEEERPTAFFCSSDEEAVGLIRAAKNYDLTVPGDFSVVGHDNWRNDGLESPFLTTFEYPGEEIGKMAASIIIDRIAHKAASFRTTTVLAPNFLIRDSVRNLTE